MDIKNKSEVEKNLSTERWNKLRENDPLKLVNIGRLSKFNNTLREIQKEMKCEGLIQHFDMFKNPAQSTTKRNIIYFEGSPNFNHFRVTPDGYNILSFPRFNFWKKHDVDSNIREKLLELPNNKYNQQENVAKVKGKYNLFVLQNPWIDQHIIRDVLRYAKETKTHTVFKGHPIIRGKVKIEIMWKKFYDEGLISEYSSLVKDVNLDPLIDKADLVILKSSGAGMQALIKGKKMVLYKDCDYSEVVPLITTMSELGEVKQYSKKDQDRFLSWYYNKFSIDVDASDFKEKLTTRIEDTFIKNKTLEEIFT
jgi:capsule polysaccharide export protein KpsC/LpsZ